MLMEDILEGKSEPSMFYKKCCLDGLNLLNFYSNLKYLFQHVHFANQLFIFKKKKKVIWTLFLEKT